MPDTPCTWPINYSVAVHELPTDYAALTDVQREPFETAATEFLWRWTRRVLGVCTSTISPALIADCGIGWSTMYYGHRPTVTMHGPYQRNLTGCRCRTCLKLPDWPVVELPGGPVLSVSEVTLDSVIFDDWTVEHGRLYRVDGDRWPAVDGVDWTVTYRHGVEVPVGGQIAAGVLAVELWRASRSDKACQLPQRMQTITRQGVTVAMLDSFDDVDKGHTGIWVMDSWVTSMASAPRPARMYSPDTVGLRR